MKKNLIASSKTNRKHERTPQRIKKLRVLTQYTRNYFLEQNQRGADKNIPLKKLFFYPIKKYFFLRFDTGEHKILEICWR